MTKTLEKPDREERIQIKLTYVDPGRKIRKQIRELFDIVVFEGDTGEITYTFNHRYYNVVKQLEQIESLLDTGQVKLISTKELTGLRCLIQDFYNKIEKLEKKYNP